MKLVQRCLIYLLFRVRQGEKEQHEGLKQGTSAGLGVDVQVSRIMGEKVLLLIAALELRPALWNTKDRSDTLQRLGPVNVWLSSGMLRFLLTPPPNPEIPTLVFIVHSALGALLLLIWADRKTCTCLGSFIGVMSLQRLLVSLSVG